jgi:hypothetical protein
MREYDRPIVGSVFVKQDASLGIAQQPRQRGLAIDEDLGDALDQGRSGAPGKGLERLSVFGLPTEAWAARRGGSGVAGMAGSSVSRHRVITAH